MAGGGVQKIYMVFLREPSRRDRSGSDLFHLRDGFEIKMNFDRNVSCLIAVYSLMDNDFFNQAVEGGGVQFLSLIHISTARKRAAAMPMPFLWR